VAEAKKDPAKAPKKGAKPAACEGPGCDAADDEMDDEEDDYEDDYEEGMDPIEAPHMTEQLVARIERLDLAALPDEALANLAVALAEKTFEQDGSPLATRCGAVAEALAAALADRGIALDEAGMFDRIRAFISGKLSKHLTTRAKKGFNKKANGKGYKRVALALARRRKKTSRMWRKGGGGHRSLIKSKRLAGIRGESIGESVLAAELAGLLAEGQMSTTSARMEVLGLLESCFDLLSDEILDEAVDQVFEAALTPLAAGFHAGRLDEAVMDEDAFMAEIGPAVTLLSRTMDKVDRGLAGNA
jgi:hypothetical protein